MTFKRCFWLLVSLLIIIITAGQINGNSPFYYIYTTVFIVWMLTIWCALALFKGAEGPKPKNVIRNS